jgi:hypothetical protein
MRVARHLFLALAACAAGGAACGEGRLLIQLERPQKPELDPLVDTRLAKFGLRVIHEGKVTDQDAFRTGDELTVGTIPTESYFDLRLAGKTASDEMIGLGLVVDVKASDRGETTVEVKFRKPVGYVAAGGQINALDTAADRGGRVDLAVFPVSGVTDVASTPNGVMVLAVAGARLVPIRTIDHGPLPEVKLDAPGTCIGVTPDSSFAVICHRDQQAVSVVEVNQLQLLGVAKLPGAPSKVAFGADHRTAFILLGGVTPQTGCVGTASQLATFDVRSLNVRSAKNLGRLASDVVIARDGSALLAMPCPQGALGQVPVEGEAKVVAALPSPYDITLVDQNAISMGGGTDAQGRAAGQVVTFDLNQGFSAPQTRSFVLPPLEVPFTEPNQPGYLSWVSAPSGMVILDFAVAPDTRRAIVLFQANYASDQHFGPCAFTLQARGTGYLLVDLATSSVLALRYTQLVFNACSAPCLKTDKFGQMDVITRCEPGLKAAMQEIGLLLNPESEAAASTLLFGGS